MKLPGPSNFNINLDDKDLGIISLAIIAIISLFRLEDANLALQCVTAIGALVVGNKLMKKEDK